MLKSLNEITEEDLTEIKNLAALFFSPREIAVMREIKLVAMITATEDEESKVYEAFYSGRLQSEMELRKSIIKLAKSGSSPAQTMALDLFNKSKLKIREK